MNHIRRLVSQWQQCATKSKIAVVKEFYALRVNNAQAPDKPFWKHMVHKVVVDGTFQQLRKVYYEAKEERKLTAHTRKADGELGIDHAAPSSVERKPKGPRHIGNTSDENTESEGEEAPGPSDEDDMEEEEERDDEEVGQAEEEIQRCTPMKTNNRKQEVRKQEEENPTKRHTAHHWHRESSTVGIQMQV